MHVTMVICSVQNADLWENEHRELRGDLCDHRHRHLGLQGSSHQAFLTQRQEDARRKKREQKQSEIWWWSLVPPVQYCQLQCCSCPCPSGWGSDMIFVLTDAWRQSAFILPHSNQEEVRKVGSQSSARNFRMVEREERWDCRDAGIWRNSNCLIVDCAALQQAWSYKPCSMFCTEGSRLCCRSLLVFSKHSKLAFSSSFPRFGWRGNLQENPWKPCIYTIYSPVKTVVSCRFSQNQPIEKIGSRIGRWFCQDGEEEEELDRFERAMRSYERHTSLISHSSYIYVNMISHLFIGAQNVFGLPGCWNCPSAVDATGTWRSD